MRRAKRVLPLNLASKMEIRASVRGGRILVAIDTVTDADTHSILIVTATESALSPARPLVAWNRGFL
ncbi:hypothetical protein Cseg_2044 [Caulobacter segnis ATCC 21756]|uniref:Uncharacterized protein n=2 Tax=Caulobacter segnis TaxID=88688 RepID=D5VGR9_CAUST|nr:hypothetical protein Cseg_2044 [Caulobacter segnis ATCC 21756]